MNSITTYKGITYTSGKSTDGSVISIYELTATYHIHIEYANFTRTDIYIPKEDVIHAN